LDVELEIADPVPWGSVVIIKCGVAEVSESSGVLTVSGQIKALEADDVVALDVRLGIILVEMVGQRPTIRIGDFISFAPRDVTIYPTGIWSSGE
jgi:hypothetical protein